MYTSLLEELATMCDAKDPVVSRPEIEVVVRPIEQLTAEAAARLEEASLLRSAHMARNGLTMAQQDARDEARMARGLPRSQSLSQRIFGPFGGDIDQAGDQSANQPLIWKSCCLVLDPRATVFFVQTIIILVVMIFCMYMLFTIDDPAKTQYYSGTLTLLIGICLPGPSIRRDRVG